MINTQIIKLDELMKDIPTKKRRNLGEGYVVRPFGEWGDNAVCTVIYSPKIELKPINNEVASIDFPDEYSEFEFIYIRVVQIDDYHGEPIPGVMRTVKRVLFSEPLPERSEYTQLENELAILAVRKWETHNLSATLARVFPALYTEDRCEAIQQAAEYIINRTNELKLTSIPKEKRDIEGIVKFIGNQIS